MYPTKEYDAEGDYYGVIYRGSLIKPILGIMLAVGVWWFLRRRR
ncbi:hypothetical protein [Spirosoma sp. KCTC 42546]|nr:hypothetical protein [Spirosoma sp. KCTC 42546]